MKYRVTFPLTAQMSQISYIVKDNPMETMEQQALWHYNRSREHDGLPPIVQLPRGTQFVFLPE